MKKLLTILLMFFCGLAIAQTGENPPTGTKILQAPNSPTFLFYQPDTSIWISMGAYGKAELQRANKKYPIWNHTGISNTGWTPSKVLGFDVDGNLKPVDAGSGSMVYPAAGIAVSNGSGWATSLTDNSAIWNKAITSDATFSAANYLLKTADTGRKAVASGITVDTSNNMTVPGTITTQTGLNFEVVTAPIAPTFTTSAGGAVDVGTHYYSVTYTTASGETNAANRVQVDIVAGNQTVNLTIPTSSDPRVTGRKIYRTKAGATLDASYYLATISNNTTTAYTDNIADASLTGTSLQWYRVNSTSNYITVGGVKTMMADVNLTAFGINAGRLISGSNNYGSIRTVLFGAGAGNNITTGTSNNIFGVAGQALTTGNGNAIFGDLAMVTATTYNEGCAFGPQVARYIQTGASSIFIGNGAANKQADGTTNLTASSNSIYIGRSTRGFDNNDNNSIVVGYNAIGKGANTAVWGNTSITDHYFTGKIRANTALISTNAATGRMLYSSDANGNLSYTNTPADGHVMKFTGGVPTWSAESAMVYPGAGLAKSTGSGWATSITDNSANWNTAYGWGNHASQGYVNSILINGTSGENAGGFLDFIPGSGINITKTGGHVTIAATGGGSGTVTSVGLSAPTGFTVTGSPVTTSGTLGLSFAAGYSLPSDATQANWTTAYNNRIATFTTTGNSGAATFSGNTLNIPNYTLAGLGGQPKPSTTYLQFGTSNGWSTFDGTLDRYASYVLQRIATDGGGAFVGSTFPAASTTEAGMMSATDKTNLDAAVSNSGKAIVNGFSTPYYLSSDWFNVVGGYVVPNVSLSVANTPYLISDEAVYDALLLKANLSGATFTGAISGTSATFSSTVTASDFQLSDRRLKTDIRKLKNIDWADRIDFVSYRMKADSSQRLRYGVIAQDVEKYAPELVNTDENGTKSVSYIDLLIVKNQQLQNQINFQRYEILFSICLSCFLFVVVILRGSKRT